jgi:hypothetical protein
LSFQSSRIPDALADEILQTKCRKSKIKIDYQEEGEGVCGGVEVVGAKSLT